MKTHRIVSSVALVLFALVAGRGLFPAVLAQQPAAAAAKNPYLKLVEPWPDASTLNERKRLAEQRPLFHETAPLVFTLTSNFKVIDKDRNPDSHTEYPGTLMVEGQGNRPLSVTLSARGHFRRMARNCRAVPLKVEFSGRDAAGSVFDGQSSLKLGTGCERNDEYDQITLREYLTYRLFNAVTPQSFRARLARGTYMQTDSDKPLATRYAIFLEHQNDVARRMGGRIVEIPRVEFKTLEAETLTRMMLFEYMLGNTDFSIYALHNVVIVQTPDKILWPVPYDFDMSGLVNAPYANADPRLRIASVTERLYRGPCRTVEEFDKAAAPFRAHRQEILAEVADMKELEPQHRARMKVYLDDFFKDIETADSLKKKFVNGCKAVPAM